jgi:uncharacterized LabA/DUF88 family protein
MFERRSALLIDFDNLHIGKFEEKIDNWLLWLERGEFDPRRKRRRFLTKRVYWYGAHDKIRAPFERAGFEAYACRSQIQGKNPTDMMIALDAIDLANQMGNLQEIILLSSDTDFVPVAMRLRERKFSVGVMVQADNPSAVIYRDFADHLISRDALRDAMTFAPPVRKPLFAFAAGKAKARDKADAKPRDDKRSAQLRAAADILVAATASLPGPMGRDRVCLLLAKMQGFSKSGPGAYLGQGSYPALLDALAAIDARLQVIRYTGPRAGVAIRHA